MTTEPPSGSFRLRSMGLTAYGPTIVNGTGFGAMLPVLALRARELGADVSTAALVVALLGLGTLVASLPAGALVARIGERRALFLVGLVEGSALLLAATADSVEVLGAAVVATGMTWAVFLIARQGYIIDAVPASHRARALSGLGGSFRVGMLLGPLAGAALITRFGLSAPFVLAAVLAVASSLMALLMPDLGSVSRTEQRASGHLSVWSVLAAHRGTLLTLGTAVVVISASRSVRFGLLPLWADQVGIPAATTSLIFAAGAAIDIACFYPGGLIMDTRGRAVVAVPVVLSASIACLLLPLAMTTAAVTAVVVFMAVGNGLGSGIVMTLGADAAPTVGRAQFLGGWRLCGDIGGTGGPLLIGAVAAVTTLATASVVIGALGLLGSVWVGHWVRASDRRRTAPRTV